MTTTLERPPTGTSPGDGGGPARRAMVRWAWRLFRREWRQQLLVLALVVVAVGATFLGATVATTSQAPAGAGFGTAHDLATFQTPTPHLAATIDALAHRYGPVDVIENETVAVPGSIATYDLRAQDPDGPFGRPMLMLVSGHFPTGPGQVALTPGVASEMGLKIGGVLDVGGSARRVVGTVENPQSLLDEFALVVPGQVTNPTQVKVLFSAPGVAPTSIGPNVQDVTGVKTSNPINPQTIVLTLATVGMLLIALVAVGGFTVLAQRRLRSIGMLGALGATDANIRLVVRANGVIVGVVGAVAGTLLGLAAWLAYRPTVESNSHHLIAAFQLPWTVIVVAMALAVAATYFAASRPARSITRVPVVVALSGRPAAPREIHRSALPGIAALVAAFILFTVSGSIENGGGAPELVCAFVTLIAAIVLLSPLCIATMAVLARRVPIAERLALRDLSRYRSRSGSALAAIGVGVMIAVVVSVIAAARYGNVLDYAGPNLASNQVVIYVATTGPRFGPGAGPGSAAAHAKAPSLQAQAESAHGIAVALGTRQTVTLETVNATLQHAAPGRQFSGPLYVATPQLLHAFGIRASSIGRDADVLSMRPGFSAESDMQLVFGNKPGPGPTGPGQRPNAFPCPKSKCLANPVIEEVSALPPGTSAPNTVITEHAVRQLHLHTTVAGWLVQTPHPLTASQVDGARSLAAAASLSVETRSSAPSSAEIIGWATVFGFVLALGLLAMTVGLIRSETASDLRTLAATGASSWTRRAITAATAGTLGFLGAVLGTVAAYVAAAAWFEGNQLTGIGALGHVPVANLLVILVGMPLLAAAGGWLLSGRAPRGMASQPIE
jgi:putative ABC transport system permease protein